MSDDLLPYYNRELGYIRKLGREFARANPDVASQLRIDAESGQDPYVERLIEAFAYLNARTRKKLDDGFPEIAEAMLSILYPHYLAPIPSLSIAQIALDPGQGGLVAGYPIARGSALESEEVAGEPCQYRTCYPLRLFPLRVASAGILPLNRAPSVSGFGDAVETLHIKLETFGDDGPLSKMNFDTVRFFIAGEAIHANAIYELLFNDAVGVALANGLDDRDPVVLPQGALRPAGFAPDEALLPYGPRSFRGYCLLTEYFALPEKFRFFDVCGLSEVVRARFARSAEIVVFSRKTHDELQRNISADTFRLGCTPIVNLFTQRADPFRLTQARSQYHVVPDVRRTHAMEIYSVDRVTGTGSDGRTVEFHPFYSVAHVSDQDEQQAFWHATRREAGYTDGKLDAGTEIDLAFVDLTFSPAAPADLTIEVLTTCLNRDLPARLEFGGGRPTIKMFQGGPLAPIRCLTPPTPTRRPALARGTLWRLVSHLSLNHLSLVENGKGAAALQELLSLYDFVGSKDLLAKIQSITNIASRRKTARVHTSTASGHCRGVEVTIELDEQRFADQGMFLFATVLERFFALYCSLNSFTQLIATAPSRDGEFHRWPPRAADKYLL